MLELKPQTQKSRLGMALAPRESVMECLHANARPNFIPVLIRRSLGSSRTEGLLGQSFWRVPRKI